MTMLQGVQVEGKENLHPLMTASGGIEKRVGTGRGLRERRVTTNNRK